MPFELHPEIPEEGWDLPKETRETFGGASSFLREEANKSGYHMIAPEIIPNSRRALEASEFAREHGKLADFHSLVFRKFYSEGLDINQWNVLTDAAVEVGLNADEMHSNTDNGNYNNIVTLHKQQGINMGIRGVPVYIFENKYVVMGLQPFAAFQEVMDTLLEDSKQNQIN